MMTSKRGNDGTGNRVAGRSSSSVLCFVKVYIVPMVQMLSCV